MASARSSPLLVRSAPMDDAVVVRMTGVLDSTTYHLARDAVVKAALEVPRAVLVVVDGLESTLR